jgi:hypothetical protein
VRSGRTPAVDAGPRAQSPDLSSWPLLRARLAMMAKLKAARGTAGQPVRGRRRRSLPVGSSRGPSLSAAGQGDVRLRPGQMAVSSHSFSGRPSRVVHRNQLVDGDLAGTLALVTGTIAFAHVDLDDCPGGRGAPRARRRMAWPAADRKGRTEQTAASGSAEPMTVTPRSSSRVAGPNCSIPAAVSV